MVLQRDARNPAGCGLSGFLPFLFLVFVLGFEDRGFGVWGSRVRLHGRVEAIVMIVRGTITMLSGVGILVC